MIQHAFGQLYSCYQLSHVNKLNSKPPWWQNDSRWKSAQLLRKFNWTLAFGVTASDLAHINIKELRALRMYVRRRARYAFSVQKGERILVLCDSMAATGAVNHGRSPSPAFNNGLRQLLPDLFASNLQLAAIWIPSEANPSDAPSRDRHLWTWYRDVDNAAEERRAWQQQSKVDVPLGEATECNSDTSHSPKPSQ